MARNRRSRIPSYRLHKPSRQAVVTLNGRDFYLGEFDTETSKQEYDRLVGEWQANGWRLPTGGLNGGPADLTVSELIAAYWEFAKGYYVKHGRPTDEQYALNAAFRPLRKLYGQTPAREFGPLRLKTIRQALIDADLSRTYANDCINRIKRAFKWAAENEMIPPSVLHGLQAVGGLRRGRSDARESEPVRPVPDAHVKAILPFVSSQVGGMIKVQELTGMRPGEVTIMRGIDLDMSGELWEYRPAEHKGEHFERERVIAIGPRAQSIIEPFLKPDLSAYLFSPGDAEADRNARRRASRKSPMTPSQARRRRKRNRRRSPREHYTTHSYRRAIARACDLAFPPPDGLNEAELMQWRRERRWQLRCLTPLRLRVDHLPRRRGFGIGSK